MRVGFENEWLITNNSGVFDPNNLMFASETIGVFPRKINDIIDEACSRLVRGHLTEDLWKKHLGDQQYRKTCDTATARRAIGRDLAKAGRLEDAIEGFEEALSLEPPLELDPKKETTDFYAQGLLEKGRRFLRDGDSVEALAAFAEAKNQNPNLILEPKAELARFSLEMAEHHFENGDIDQAKNRFQEAFELNPKLAENPYFELANYWFRLALERLKGKNPKFYPKGGIAAIERARSVESKQPASISVLDQICLLAVLGVKRAGSSMSAKKQ